MYFKIIIEVLVADKAEIAVGAQTIRIGLAFSPSLIRLQSVAALDLGLEVSLEVPIMRHQFCLILGRGLPAGCAQQRQACKACDPH